MSLNVQVSTNDSDNLKHHPVLVKSSSPLVTLGDLHGNSLKLLYFLLKSGVVFWPDDEAIKPEDLYQEFYNAYHTTPPTAESLHQLKSLITRLQVNETEPLPYLRFLGDELADRGSNDLISLWLFDYLHQQGVPYDCCYSNHTHEFMENYISVIINQDSCPQFYPTFQSFFWLHYCMTEDLIDKAEVIRLVDNHKTHLRIINYSLGDSRISQYTHAPTSHNMDQFLAQKLGLFYISNTPEFRAWSMEQINKSFGFLLANNQVLNLFDKEIIHSLSKKKRLTEQEHPFEHTIWNRTYTDFLSRPTEHPEYGYMQGSIYGHDSDDPERNQTDIIGLDNLFGKIKEYEQCSTLITNPVLHCNEQHLDQRQIEDIELKIKAFIKADIEQLIGQSPHQGHKHSKRCMSKINYYQQLLGEVNFSELHPDIHHLMNYTYHLINKDLLSDQSTKRVVENLSEHIKEIKERMSTLKEYNHSSPTLEELHSSWTQLLENIRKNQEFLQKALDLFNLCERKITQKDLSYTHLTPILRQLIEQYQVPSLALKMNKTDLQNKGTQVLIETFEKEYQEIEDCQYYERTHLLAQKLNELIILAELLEIPLDDKYQLLLYRIILSEEKTFRDILEQGNDYEWYSKELHELCNTTVPADNDFLIQVQSLIKGTLFHLNVPPYDYNEYQKEVKEHYISRLQQLYKEEQEAIEELLTQELTHEELLSIQNRFFILKEYIKPKKTFTDLEYKFTEYFKHLDEIRILKNKLLLHCTNYNEYLQTKQDQNPQDSLLQEKIAIMTRLIDHLQKSEYTAQCINDFTNEFEGRHQTIQALRKVFSVTLSAQGFINKGLSFFSKRTDMTLSKGAKFVAEIKEILRTNADNNVTLAPAESATISI